MYLSRPWILKKNDMQVSENTYMLLILFQNNGTSNVTIEDTSTIVGKEDADSPDWGMVRTI